MNAGVLLVVETRTQLRRTVNVLKTSNLRTQSGKGLLGQIPLLTVHPSFDSPPSLGCCKHLTSSVTRDDRFVKGPLGWGLGVKPLKTRI